VSEGTEEYDCVKEDKGKDEGKCDKEREMKDNMSEKANRSAVLPFIHCNDSHHDTNKVLCHSSFNTLSQTGHCTQHNNWW
jgi:hypothetical protein